MRYFLAIFGLSCLAVLSFFGLRGTKSTKPPVYVFPDMDFQAKYLPQGENDFFANQMDDRPVVQGTVARGYEWNVKKVFSENFAYAPDQNPALYSGKDISGEWYRGFPVPVTNELMELGQQKYAIFCAVCHGALGDGNGITKQYGMIATPTYHDDRLRDMAEGEIFNTITHGKNTMNPYADKLTPEERWAVILYVRALQQARNASLNDVPTEYRSKLGI
ncbi:MAG TPA: cytochrome C [Opitutae bacterium]|nr:cytochrome C [Opitutae bacterium]|tara:strand:+ start:1803 stop:2459 length:657 start_codon:yes stop_codon:yes gene_type:complete